MKHICVSFDQTCFIHYCRLLNSTFLVGYELMHFRFHNLVGNIPAIQTQVSMSDEIWWHGSFWHNTLLVKHYESKYMYYQVHQVLFTDQEKYKENQTLRNLWTCRIFPLSVRSCAKIILGNVYIFSAWLSCSPPSFLARNWWKLPNCYSDIELWIFVSQIN